MNIIKPKILLNASNLHVGGGVQVAVSLLDELSRIDDLPVELHVLASDEVHDNLLHTGCDCTRFSGYMVFNTYGLSTLWSGLARMIREFDIVFTVFGPFYMWPSQRIDVVGFAQSWLIYPDNEVYQSLPYLEKLENKLKFSIQSFFFKCADRLVVELEHVKNGLVARNFLDPDRIDVVPNCLGSMYFRPEQWRPLGNRIIRRNYSIGFVGRDFPHKNTIVLPEIKKILRNKYGLNVDFYVTFNSAEWSVKSDFFRESINNVGVLDVAQCPSFYQQMDAVIFPSFLESFSATPLEALVMRKPLFASDRSFVRDVCGDFAWYFDPEDPRCAADLIANYINNYAGYDDAKLASAREHVIQFSNARQRAIDYLRIMRKAGLSRSIS